MNVEIKTVGTSGINLNPDNPRRIGNVEMDRLVRSLESFPDMLHLREIVVDETMTVLGGNMRLLALRKMGVKECLAKIVTGLTPEQKREFIVKDNGAWGDWDFDALANSWSDLPLAEWGIDIPEDWMATVDEVSIPALKDGDRLPYREMTFTVHDDQFATIQDALKKAKEQGGDVSDLNENSNGNALAFICAGFNLG